MNCLYRLNKDIFYEHFSGLDPLASKFMNPDVVIELTFFMLVRTVSCSLVNLLYAMAQSYLSKHIPRRLTLAHAAIHQYLGRNTHPRVPRNAFFSSLDLELKRSGEWTVQCSFSAGHLPDRWFKSSLKNCAGKMHASMSI